MAARYRLRSPCFYANFVSSVDGVTALGPGHPDSGGTISGHSEADRFVMALLRASADAILVGAGTLPATPVIAGRRRDAYPAAAADFTELRRQLNRPIQPLLVAVDGRRRH